MLSLLLSLCLSADPAPAQQADTVLVAPREYLSAMQPWIQHRTAQGHRFVHVPNSLPAEEIREAIRILAKSGKLQHILLIGDAEPAAAARARSVPTHFAKAKINVQWGSEPEIATDNWYADLDDDQLPDLTIGRLPADSPEELNRLARKIVEYERHSPHAGQRRVNFVAGVGGFGPVVDSVIESATTKFLTDGIPATFATTMTQGSWRSPYCPDPRRFHEATIARLNEGCLFWVYMGHGHSTGLDRVRVPGGDFHILDVRDAPRVRCPHCPPIAVFLACYTGAFDRSTDCLAEELLRAEQGPVAAFCGSRVTMPYAMAVLGTSMMKQYFEKREPLLGRIILAAKRELGAELPAGDGVETKVQNNRDLLDAIAKVISPAPDKLTDERREHILLFNLLGDPLLRLPMPVGLEIASPKEATAGDRLEITGRCDTPGRCTIELVTRRDKLRIKPVNRPSFDPSASSLAGYHETYSQAIDDRWVVEQTEVIGGELRLSLRVPREARGPCHVRVVVEGEKGTALGATDVFVRRGE